MAIEKKSLTYVQSEGASKRQPRTKLPQDVVFATLYYFILVVKPEVMAAVRDKQGRIPTKQQRQLFEERSTHQKSKKLGWLAKAIATIDSGIWGKAVLAFMGTNC